MRIAKAQSIHLRVSCDANISMVESIASGMPALLRDWRAVPRTAVCTRTQC